MRVLKGHTAPVRCLAYSPDGRLLASGGEDRAVRLWNLADAMRVSLMGEHADQVRAIVFRPDGRQFASCGWDNEAHLWNNFTGKPRRSIALDRSGGYSLAYSPDGNIIAIGDGSGRIRFVRARGRMQNPVVMEGHQYPVFALSFHPDGRRLASASQDRTVRLWETDWGREQWKWEYGEWVRALAFSSDGAWLATGCDDGRIHLAEPRVPYDPRELIGHTAAVCHLRFSPDGRSLLSAGWDGTVRVWDWISGRQTNAYDFGIGRVHAVAVSPDGLTAAAAGQDHSIIVWDLD